MPATLPIGRKTMAVDSSCGFDADESLSRAHGGIVGLRKRITDAGGQLLFAHRKGCTLALVTMNGDTDFLPLTTAGGSGND